MKVTYGLTADDLWRLHDLLAKAGVDDEILTVFSDDVQASEYGVGLEQLADSLVEYDVPVSADAWRLLFEAGVRYGVDRASFRRLIGRERHAAAASTERRAILDQMPEQAGGLIEIVMIETTARDWQKALDWLHRSGVITSFAVDGSEAEPVVSEGMFDDERRRLMVVRVAAQTWTTSLPDADRIDLQGDPREIRTERDVDGLLWLMAGLAGAAGKTALLLPETLDPEGTAPLHIVPPGNLGPVC